MAAACMPLSMMGRRDAKISSLKPQQISLEEEDGGGQTASAGAGRGIKCVRATPTNKISGLTLALEVCHSSQSVAFNSLTGIAPEFKCRMAADGVE